jgi:hypothetical protein
MLYMVVDVRHEERREEEEESERCDVLDGEKYC